MISVVLFTSFSAFAQTTTAGDKTTPTTTVATTTPAPAPVVSVPKTDWLKEFNSVKIDGPMNVVMKRVATTDEIHIVYDTKGCVTSKFKAEIDKNGTLVVEEKYDPNRTTVTDITIYYKALDDVRIAHAKVEFEDTVDAKIFDLTVSGGAIVVADVDCLDIAVECTGRTLLTLSGKTRYMTISASTSKINCSKLQTTSSTVEVSHGAELRLNVSERLEATTSTSAKLIYKGQPVIFRDHSSIFGGDIIKVDD